jgi:type I restriction enzyme, S subunit
MSSDVAELTRPVSAVPDGWRSCKLGEVAVLGGGTTPSRAVEAYWLDAAIPWATPSDITSLPIGVSSISETESRVSDWAMAECSLPLNPPGTVLMTSRATIGFAAINAVPMTTNQGFITFKAGECLDPAFLLHWLTASRSDLVAAAGGSTFKELSRGTAKLLPVLLPPLDEQQRIAEVLRSVDEAIAASQATLQQSEVALSALSDDLFAATMSGDDSEWGQYALEDMLENIIDYRGVPPPKADSGIPLLTAKNVRFGYLDFEPREYIAAKDYDSWMRRGLPSAGDIMFTTEAPLGNVAEFPDIKAALGQRTLTLVPKPGKLDPKFLKWLLLSKPAQALIWSHATGSTAKGIKQRTFRKLKFGFPSLDEQVRIAQLLENIGAARDAAKRSNEAYAAMKAHLMADLLSGRVRMPA